MRILFFGLVTSLVALALLRAGPLLAPDDHNKLAFAVGLLVAFLRLDEQAIPARRRVSHARVHRAITRFENRYLRLFKRGKLPLDSDSIIALHTSALMYANDNELGAAWWSINQALRRLDRLS